MKAFVLFATVVVVAVGALPASPVSRARIPKRPRGAPDAAPAASNASVSVLINNGKMAEIGQFPWMANIVMDDAWYCGGSLISDKHILTAAQCASGYGRFLVTLGDVHTYSSSDYFVFAYTYKSCWHEDYKEEIHLNDIGIIELLYSVTVTGWHRDETLHWNTFTLDGVKPIALAPQSSDTYSGVTATVSGFGMSVYGYESNDLMYVEQPVMDNSLCARYLGKDVTDSHICGDGSGGIGTCKGDGGDPLVVPVTDSDTGATTWMLVGVASFQSDVDCGLGYPSAYTRVTSYLDWIAAKVAGGAACYPGQ
ncbi:Brachyurin [Frankliniella fusca]|uniref:Brachyurin n=1 Tax=Frankliniella fusca TaxID=407009 RepID=A0AAE1HQ57_9NEOP|nr:Brachyurin [Frankliniella fusca]